MRWGNPSTFRKKTYQLDLGTMGYEPGVAAPEGDCSCKNRVATTGYVDSGGTSTCLYCGKRQIKDK